MAEALRLTYEAVLIESDYTCSTDAISGGMYAASPAIDRRFIEEHHVDLYVPGNPAHPLTFINGILDLLSIA